MCDPIILPQEPDQQVDECNQQQDWRVYGQEDNINESEDGLYLKDIYIDLTTMCHY